MRGGPGGTTASDFFIAYDHADGAVLGVDGDLVAGFYQGDGSTCLRFRSDVPHNKAMTAAGETAVCQQRHILAQTRTNDGAGRREHLRHAGAALGAFKADHDDVPFLNFSLFQPGQHGLFRIIDAGIAFENQPLFARDFGHGALWGQVAAQNLDVAGLFDGVGKRPYHLLTLV